MAEEGPRKVGTLAIFGIAILLNLLLTIVLLDQVDRSRAEMRTLNNRLATRQDIAMLRPLGINRILRERCSGCHSARRLAATMQMEEQTLVATVARMSAHSKGAIPPNEFKKISAALLVRRCTSCHGESVVSRILLYPEEERIPVLLREVSKPGSGVRRDQVEELARAIRLLADEGA
jgi:uncharacterized membrane protein